MAVSIPSVGTTAETATSVATPTTLSPGLPATRAVGDVLLCLTVCRSGTPTVSCSTAGWVELANVAGANGRLALYACLVTGSEVAAQPVWASLTTGTSGTGASAQIAAVRGLDFTRSPLTGLVHKLSAAQDQAASTTAQAMGNTITPTVPNSAIFSLAVRQDNDVTDANWPVIATGNNITWAKVAAVLNSASGNDHAQSFQFGQQGAATAIAAKSVTVVSGSLDASSAILISLLTAQTFTLGVETETDAAVALTKTQQAQSKTLGVETETDSALALSKTQQAQSKTLTAAVETEAALPLDYEIVSSAQHVNISPAVETGAPVALTFTQQAQSKSLASAAESDVAAALTHAQTPQSKSLSPTGESDSALALAFTQNAQTRTLAVETEADAAVALAFTQAAQTRTLNPTSETDAASALSKTQAAQERMLSPASESEFALPLIVVGQGTHVTLAPATEAGSARALSITQGPAQSKTIAASTEADVALALTVTQGQPHSLTLGPASELDTATPIAPLGPGATITPATTIDSALALSYTRTFAPATGGQLVTGDRVAEIAFEDEGALLGVTGEGIALSARGVIT